ncbi:MAG: malto-oligosyltrehalose synthase [Thermoprotei archaeon]
MTILSTYRLQLNKEFNLLDVEQLLDYFNELGVTHLYLSPVLKARPGSPHCYDVVDHSLINPELGGEEAYRKLLQEAKLYGLGIIQDIVPNHMAVHPTNWRLMDVLEKGQQSEYSEYFDIDWCASKNLVLPLLEAPLDNLIARRIVKLGLSRGKPCVVYGENNFPLNNKGIELLHDVGGNTLENVDPNLVRKILDAQYYTLTWFHDQPNYRRFFQVNDLIGVNVEKRWVFEESHSIISMISKLGVDGFRVDHVDGLMYPATYLEWLRSFVGGKYVVVEKILGEGEDLRGWTCEGTTGYDFLNALNRIFVDQNNEEFFTKLYEEFTERKIDLDQLILTKKRFVVENLLRSEFQRVFKLFSNKTVWSKELEEKIVDFITRLPVYRTYFDGASLSKDDLDILNRVDPSGEIRRIISEAKEAFVRLQQILPAVTAKGFEDSVLYVYNRLIALNEVGGFPAIFGSQVDVLHGFNMRRLKRWPLSMSTTSTHDSKFSEDVRCRLSTISQLPHEWLKCVSNLHNTLNPQIDKNDEYRVYQTLVGSWPFEGPTSGYRDRMRSHILKALREAGENSCWANPNNDYENKVCNALENIFSQKSVRQIVEEMVRKVTPIALVYSLSTVTLKMTSPGVADTYQGCETWRFLLTDPDNRIPVDFRALRQTLSRAKTATPQSLMTNMEKSELKMFATFHLLHLRRRFDKALLFGDYKPVKTPPEIIGYMRGGRILVLAPVHIARIQTPPVGDAWGENTVNLDGGRYVDLFTTQEITVHDNMPLAELFAHFPIAVLIKQA